MINLQFNNHCPFCKELLPPADYSIYFCDNCLKSNLVDKLELYYELNILNHICINKYNGLSKTFLIQVQIDFPSNTQAIHHYPPMNKLLLDYIPDFNSLKELLEMSNTLMLFK
jgi:hypothetical protein